MSTYTHRDYDGDTLTFVAGNASTLVTIHSDSENYAASADVPKRKAVEVAQALLEAAGIDAIIACPGCRLPMDDEEFGRDEDCVYCFIDGAPLTQEEVTAP